MAELKVYLPDKLDERFRKAAMRVYGYGRGSISKAAVDALSEWCGKHETTTNLLEKVGEASERSRDLRFQDGEFPSNPDKAAKDAILESSTKGKLGQDPAGRNMEKGKSPIR